MIICRFSSSSGFGSWSGNSPFGLEVHLLQLERRACSRIGPTIGPAMPLPPSTTTFIGFTLAGSMKESAWASELLPDVDLLEGAAARAPAQPGFDLGLDVADAGVAGERQRALADQLHPGVGLGVVGGGDHRAAVELARADQVVEHLGRDHAGVEHGRALEDQAVAQLRRHRRRGQPHVAAEPDPQLAGLLAAQPAEHAGEGAADRVRGALVHLAAVEPADVVGLEDPGRRQGGCSLKTLPSAPRSSARSTAASLWCRR